MKKSRKWKTAADVAVILSGLVLGYSALCGPWSREWSWGLLAVSGCVTVYFLADLYRLNHKAAPEPGTAAGQAGIEKLVLLDEQNRPVRSWNLAGRTSLVVGKRGTEDVDVDLADCEYGCFVDYQHAALNFCLDSWYVEDLGSRNGIRIRKVEDGQCYKLTGRPCRVTAGDILYIASTRLLFS